MTQFWVWGPPSSVASLGCDVLGSQRVYSMTRPNTLRIEPSSTMSLEAIQNWVLVLETDKQQVANGAVQSVSVLFYVCSHRGDIKQIKQTNKNTTTTNNNKNKMPQQQQQKQTKNIHLYIILIYPQDSEQSI